MKTNQKTDQNANLWFPKNLTKTLLIILIGIWSSIIASLIVNDYPENVFVFNIYIWSTFCFIIALYATWNILAIRIMIDEKFENRKLDNAKAKNKVEISHLWTVSLQDNKSYKSKYIILIRIGVFFLLLGIISLIFVNYNIREEAIKDNHYIKTHINKIEIIIDSMDRIMTKNGSDVKALSDSLNSLNKKFEKLNKNNSVILKLLQQ